MAALAFFGVNCWILGQMVADIGSGPKPIKETRKDEKVKALGGQVIGKARGKVVKI